MAALEPVPRPAADPRLARLAHDGLSFFQLVSESPRDADCRLAALVEHYAGAGTSWIARVVGGRDEVAYVLDVLGDPPSIRSQRRNAMRRHHRAVFRLGSLNDVLMLVDAVATAGCELLLLQSDTAAGQQVHDVLVNNDEAGAAVLARLVILRGGGGAATLVGHRDSIPTPWQKPASPRAVAAMAPLQRLPDPSHRGRRVAVVALVLPLLVVAGAGAAYGWRHGSGPAPPATGPTTAASQPALLLEPVLAAPDVRLGARAVYDRVHHQAVLFGGVGSYDRTWLWNGRVWNQVRGGAPAGRFASALAADGRTGQILLFGGRDATGALLGDTWSWDGHSWLQLPTPVAPPADEFPVMTYDEARQTIVLVSGCCGDRGRGPQTWTWDGAAWIEQRSAQAAPAGLTSAMAYDPTTRTVLLLGAGDPPGAGTSTWSWDGSGWRDLRPAHSPPLGASMAMVLDPRARQPLLLTTLPLSRQVRTWRWDGADWSEEHPPLSPVDATAVVADADINLVVVFGHAAGQRDGIIQVTWAWTGTTWTQLRAQSPQAAAGIRPPPRFETAMAYDQARGELVLFGGGAVSTSAHVDLGDTWTWDGTAWRNRSPPTSPSPRQGAVMAFDPVSQTVLLYGGYVSTPQGLPPLEETWRWNGTGWLQLHPASAPPAGSTVDGMAYDELSASVVLVTSCCDVPPGIGSGAPRRVDTWAWNGAEWVQRHPASTPPAPGPAAMAFDRAAGVLLALVQGDQPDGAGTTWAWDGSTWRHLDEAGAQTQVDALTVTLTDDPAGGRVVLLERRLVGPVPGGGVQSWDGASWVPRSLPDGFRVDTARHATQPFADRRLGRVVVIGGAFDDFRDVWMWTGTTWVELQQSGQPEAASQVGIGAGPRVLHR